MIAKPKHAIQKAIIYLPDCTSGRDRTRRCPTTQTPGQQTSPYKQSIATLFDGPVDVMDRTALQPCPARGATGDAIMPFDPDAVRRWLDDTHHRSVPAQTFAAGMHHDALRGGLRKQ
jgi:hypothetical protein